MLAVGHKGGFAFRGARAPAASATEAKGGGANGQASSANRRWFQKQLLPNGVEKKKKAQIF